MRLWKLKNLENYCTVCEEVTTWKPDRVAIANKSVFMYKCDGCDSYSTIRHLGVMQQVLTDRINKRCDEYNGTSTPTDY